MKKCLVTGGAGFIGSHVVDALVLAGHDVAAVDDLSGGFKDNVHPKARFIKGDVSDREFVSSLFKKNKFDYVYHLAAYAAEGLSHFIKHFNYTNNLLGSVNLINESIKQEIECFVFTSSIAVYGANQLPMNEEMVPVPEDPYGIAKLAVEQDLHVSRKMFGLNYVIFRPHNVYGEKQNIGDKYRNVVGIFMNQLMTGQPMTIFGDGSQTRAFSYIGDVAPIIARAPEVKEAKNQIFNIGADKEYPVKEVALEVAKSFGMEAKINHLPERNEVKNAYADHAKVKKIFNYAPKTSLTEGIRKMAEWAKKAGPRQTPKFKNIEIERGLPPSWK
jgi:UDP-glucose 4-epimerase